MTLPDDADCPRLAAEAKTLILRGQPHKISRHHEYAMARVLDILLVDAFPCTRSTGA